MDEREFLERLNPMFRSLFGIAHVITGRYELAEFTLRKAILTEYDSMDNRTRMTFSESMRQRVLKIATEQNRLNGIVNEENMTWTGFDDVDLNDNAFLTAAVKEPLNMRRILIMKFGAGLHSYEIAPIIGMDKKRVRSYLIQFETRVTHKLKNSQSYEKLARSAARRELDKTSADVPDFTTFIRQLQSELKGSYSTDTVNPVSRIVGIVFLVLGIALCIVLFWVFTVLIEPDAVAECDMIKTLTSTL